MFDDVTVVDVEHGQLLPAQRVVVQGHRITAAGSLKAVKAPAGARVVDARGKYLIPGLWDMHIHGTRSTDFVYPFLLANGVTGFRDAGSNVPLDTLRLWRREILAGNRVGPPRQLLSGPRLNIPSGMECRSRPNAQRDTLDTYICVQDPRKVVDSLKAAGADMLKMYDLTKESYFAIAAAARRVGLPFGGHLEFTKEGISAVQASDSGARILDHPDVAGDLKALCLGREAGVERCQPVAERFRRNGTWWIPTLIAEAVVITDAMGVSLDEVGPGINIPKMYGGDASQKIFERLFHFGETFWDGSAPAQEWQGWLRAPAGTLHASGGDTASDAASLSIMRRVGMPLLVGTDQPGASIKLRKMPPGFTYHAELALMVAEGLTPAQALRSATLEPARLLRATDSLGTVAPGKLADLVLLDANPLADITNTTTIRAVVANGRYYDRAALDRLLAAGRVTAKKKQPGL